MPTNVIMPALEMAQETGKVVRWLKAPGDSVKKGEPIVEIETDKVTVEIESPASGVLRDVTAAEGDVVPVGQTIALIVEAGAAAPASAARPAAPVVAVAAPSPSPEVTVRASPLAKKIADEQGIDLAHVKATGPRIQKADVLAHLATRQPTGPINGQGAHLSPASPKARRLATERGLDIAELRGSGPGGAVLAGDVPVAAAIPSPAAGRGRGGRKAEEAPTVGTVWRIMADRMTQSWTTAPHFYLVREVNATRLISWRDRAKKQIPGLTYTDLLVKLVAAAIAQHPRVNVSWKDGTIIQHTDINIGLAVAIEDGLVVPVIHRADTLSLSEIRARREDLAGRAQAAKLRPADIQGGNFTISNLGMYGVDAFNAIVNPPQAAILAVGRIADRVVAVNGQPAVQPMTALTLSCDHRALDGARGAQFLGALAELIEEPLALLV